MITLSLTMIRFGLPFAAPIASAGGLHLPWRERMWQPNPTVKSWLGMRCSS
jgi:hypothetical protein